MKIVFLTMVNLTEVDSHGIYQDLMRKFHEEGHDVFIVSPRERRTGEKTHLNEANGVHILGVRTLNLQKMKRMRFSELQDSQNWKNRVLQLKTKASACLQNSCF